MAVQMTTAGKTYWLAKCKAAEDFLAKGDFSNAALVTFLKGQTYRPPCYATGDLKAWDSTLIGYSIPIRAMIYFSGEKIYRDDEARRMRCESCRNYKVCPTDPKEKVRLCAKTLTQIAAEFRNTAKSL